MVVTKSMPTLNWIGKEQVVNHDKEVPFRLLKKVKSASVGENSQNLIIHGDNLEALKALMPFYHNKVKCIYIDPPYNTGNEGWIYNDKVNSLKIKKWLGKVVGGESEDLCRHDKWLCMMYPRLKLLRELLSENGIIFISIDDNEQGNLRAIAEEIFGEKNFISQIVWKRRSGGTNDNKYIAPDHEYILVFSKNKDLAEFNSHEYNPENLKLYAFKDKYFENRGPYRRMLLNQTSLRYSESLTYPIDAPDGTKINPPKDGKSTWRWGKEKVQWGIEKDFIEFVKTKVGWRVYTKQYLYVDSDGNNLERGSRPRSYYSEVDGREGVKELQKLLNNKAFDYPKPVQLIKYLIKMATNKNDLILDSFAGTGTTAHAVLDSNLDDDGKRKFILVEIDENIAKNITPLRVKKAIESYGYNGSFEFCELSKPLFNSEGQIEDECTFEQLAQYIYFTETQNNLEKKAIKGNFVGDNNTAEYYLLFKEKNKNVLNKVFLGTLNKNDKRKIVYADKCLLDEDTLLKHNIQFKQIPYEVKVY